jgi:hypothetical protein
VKLKFSAPPAEPPPPVPRAGLLAGLHSVLTHGITVDGISDEMPGGTGDLAAHGHGNYGHETHRGHESKPAWASFHQRDGSTKLVNVATDDDQARVGFVFWYFTPAQ